MLCIWSLRALLPPFMALPVMTMDSRGYKLVQQRNNEGGHATTITRICVAEIYNLGDGESCGQRLVHMSTRNVLPHTRSDSEQESKHIWQGT